jgi:hypothetical protein
MRMSFVRFYRERLFQKASHGWRYGLMSITWTARASMDALSDMQTASGAAKLLPIF